ncbi:MAG: hypothetical protein Kow00106_00090 [Anaerolineae bacterium]
MKRITAMLLVIVLLAAGAPLRAQQPGERIVYQQDFAGELPGWELESGWEVTPDGLLHGTGHQWARYVATDFGADWRITLRLKLVRGRIHLIYRLNEQGRYFIGLEATRSDLHKQYWPNTFLNDLAVAQASHSLGTWHAVEIAGAGPTIRLLVNGRTEWEYTDSDPLLSGTFAFETIEDSEVYIDDIVVYRLDSAGSAPSGGTSSTEEQGVTGPEGTPSFVGSVVSAARLRTAASVQSPVLRTLPAGATVIVLKQVQGESVTLGGTTSDSWYYVQVGGESDAVQGYIWAGLVTHTLAWVRTGGPLGGLGYDIRMRPDNPDVMYITDAWAGVFRSTDGGKTWQPANNGIMTRVGESGDAIPIFCLTIAPHNYNTLWTGTQNTRGIYKSTDGGDSWVQMVNGVVERDGITFRGFTVDPHDSNIVYAAAELSSWVWAGHERPGREFDMTAGVVYRTTNGGQSWTAIWRGDNLARYVWVDPRDSNVIYISTGIFDREAANSDPQRGIPGGEGVLKSTDGGQTWQHANNGLGNLYVGSLYMHPTNPDILLAGTGNNQYYANQGVYLTTDGAQSWSYVLRNDNINAVEFATSDPNIAYAASAGAVYRSEDGGWTWQQVAGSGEGGWGPPGVRAGFPIDLQVDPRDPNRLFANNYGGGNFLSTDGGRTWEVASAGYTGAQVRDIAVGPERVYAAARSGLFASDDGGITWQGLNTPPAQVMEWYVVAVDPANPRHVLAASNWMGVLLGSLDMGQHWQPVSPSTGEGKGWRAIAFAPSNPQRVYAGTSAYFSAGTFSDEMPSNGVWVSHDGGTTWQPANSGIMADANVTALAVAWDNPATVYAATGNRGLLKSTDGGASWTQNLTGRPVLAVAVDPHNANHVLAGLSFGGMRASMDGGASWSVVAAGLPPEASVSDIEFDPTTPGVIYAADRMNGVYRSTDGGLSWQTINQGLRMRSVNKLALTADGTQLYAATEGEGVFRLDVGH